MTTTHDSDSARTRPADGNQAARKSSEGLKGTYGYVWADWLYGPHKDIFMASVYNACYEIDKCDSPVMKSTLIEQLRKRVHRSGEAWVEGIREFLDFEEYRLSHGAAPVDVLDDGDDYRALAALDAAYRHGAFRGLCKTPSGAEWVGRVGEFAAACVHQGFKWVRVHGGTDEWELPTFGEAWCKGAVMWGLTTMWVAVDEAGAFADNDEVLARMHTVICAHHMAGAGWSAYRGEHPHEHREWDRAVPGRAPSPDAIKEFGHKCCWPEQMIAVLVRSAEHVNTWANPPFDPAHFDRTRGLVIADYTPRLNAALIKLRDELCTELGEAAGGITDSEAREILFRIQIWVCNFSTHWRGRGTRSDLFLETSAVGAVLGVLRENRPHLTAEFVERAVEWTAGRFGSLPREQRDTALERVRRYVEVRGRVPGAAGSALGSAGSGNDRFVDGVWDYAEWSVSQVENRGRLPEVHREDAVRMFNALTIQRRLASRYDLGPDKENHGGCWVCICGTLFRGMVDNRPTTAVNQCQIWGGLLYGNLGLGAVDDWSLGTR
ncbi:hypothetical protein ACIO3O_00435 [Streptomyces sp. NPDC087440]|uniref:hypothetical protein n=1 Tax=Streptomyces sp. NPDC087440 TaxID=3365790 RepID=UPI00381B5253